MTVRGYDHSGLSISTGCGYPYDDKWDSGVIGFIYITEERLQAEFAGDKEKATTALEAEIKEVDSWLTGQVYGFVITGTDTDGNEYDIDSCWGFYGDSKYCLEEAKSIVDHLPQQLKLELAS